MVRKKLNLAENRFSNIDNTEFSQNLGKTVGGKIKFLAKFKKNQ